MSFIPQDLYLTSGTVGIINDWQATVTKFDSSSFYNWEEDNMPVYDLEDRTSYLWERIGYPVRDGFSGIPGKMFVVSADYGFPVGQDSSGIIFRDLSSVINVLPNPITYPIIIEVASFGNLGELNLNNIKIDDSCPGAGLEIVNRVFARSKFGSTATPSALYISSDPSVSSLMVKEMFHNASALAISSLVLSATTDARLNSNNRSWIVNYAYGAQSSPVSIASLLTKKPILSFKDSSFDQSIATNKFAIAEYGNTEDPTITAYDITVTDTIAAATIERAAIVDNSNVAMLAYGNFLSNVKISNCDGPIFVRGFLVDGSLDTTGTITQSTDSGFNIVNSDVTIENAMSIRCKKHGFKIINSNVDVRRAIVAARNYEISSTTARSANSNGIGLYAENSLINFIPVNTAYVQYSGVDFISQFAFNDVGIQLNNSKIVGGNKITTSFSVADGPTMIQSLYNKRIGLEATNSIFDHQGGLEIINNYNGIVANNSKLNFPLLTVENNQEVGLEANNCDIVFNPDLIRPSVTTAYENSQIGKTYKQFTFFRNGQHMVLNHSILRYPYSTSMPSKVGNILAMSSFGSYDVSSTKGRLPAIEIKNSSRAELIHPEIKTYQTTSVYAQPLFGACVSVQDNSKVVFRGSGGITSNTGPTMLIGPQTLAAQKKAAVVYVNKNSEVDFHGNTLIAQGAVDVLAEDNSVVTFAPHRKDNKTLDVSGWDLNENKNHTRVELHAIKSCLVADKNSVINMEDLGDYTTHWGAAVLPSQDYNNGDAFNTSYYTSAGYLQFYPNPQDDNLLTGTNIVPAAINSYAYTDTAPGYFLTNYKDAASPTNIANYSKGGICVKAQNGSKVKALNVNFAAGWYNTSSAYFDSSSGNCELLRIWNICQNSELDAAYLSVSGMYPSLTGYYGPSAVYLSGAGVPASGAPSSTPDTSTLSVLDYYGLSGARAGTNYGPFRIYFSPHTQAKMLGYVSGTGAGQAAYYGAPYQMLAQGYNPSGNLIGASGFDAIYSGISTSAFYYVSAMVDPSYKNRIRLDESAADSFANAKHNAIAKSGRHALVSIYRSTTTAGGQGYDTNVAGYGKGFKSAEIFDLRRDD